MVSKQSASMQPATLALTFRRSAALTSLISLVRCFIEDFYAGVINNRNTAGRLALVVHELVENAAKYSTDGEIALFVECDLLSGAISVRTANRAAEDRIGQLRRAFAEIAAAPEAASLYMAAMPYFSSKARRAASGSNPSSAPTSLPVSFAMRARAKPMIGPIAAIGATRPVNAINPCNA
jgi:hypothetical protein